MAKETAVWFSPIAARIPITARDKRSLIKQSRDMARELQALIEEWAKRHGGELAVDDYTVAEETGGWDAPFYGAHMAFYGDGSEDTA